METKICSKCNIEKNICEFHKCSSVKSGLRSECKTCRKVFKKKFYEENKLKILEQKKNYYNKNKEEIKKKYVIRYHENYVSNENYKDYRKSYYQSNKNKFNENERVRRNSDILFKLSGNIRKRIRYFLKKNNIVKYDKTFDIVGCSPEFLREHIEKQFTDGMSWDLLGKHIHIDHIIPLSSAKNEDEIYKLCHYTNLQPLWAKDNLSKGDKIIPLIHHYQQYTNDFRQT